MLLSVLPGLLLAARILAAVSTAAIAREVSPLPAKLLQEQPVGRALGTQRSLPQLQPTLLSLCKLQPQYQVSQTVLGSGGARVSFRGDGGLREHPRGLAKPLTNIMAFHL